MLHRMMMNDECFPRGGVGAPGAAAPGAGSTGRAASLVSPRDCAKPAPPPVARRGARGRGRQAEPASRPARH
jgi:hypothetical protein